MNKTEAKYFIMASGGGEEVSSIEVSPFFSTGTWMSGRALSDSVKKDAVGKMKYKLDERRPGEILPLYEYEAIPIMRDDLLKVIQGAGVNNLEIFDAVLYDPFAKKDLTNYKAFNIVGAVACSADKTKEIGKFDDGLGIATLLEGVYIDETKADASGLLMFRLEEAVNAIVVHKKVKDAVEAVPELKHGTQFYGPGEWSG